MILSRNLLDWVVDQTIRECVVQPEMTLFANEKLMTLHASLPMYNFPEIRGILQELWHQFRTEIIANGVGNTPNQLDFSGNYRDAWKSERCLFSQTCGYPYISELKSFVNLIATPCYGFEGCNGPNYSSWIVTREQNSILDFSQTRGLRLVINGEDSLSGYKVIEMMLDSDETVESAFSEVIISGGHHKSLAYIKDGLGDFAAIDCVTWGYLHHVNPGLLAGLKIIDQGPELPGLPLISSKATTNSDYEVLRSTLLNAHEMELLSNSMDQLLIKKYVHLDGSEYQKISNLLKKQ